MAEKKRRDAEERRLAVIALVTSKKSLMAQHRASRVSSERGEAAIPFAQVRAEAEARDRRA